MIDPASASRNGSPTAWRRVAFAMFGVGYAANHFASMLLVYRARLGLSPTQLYGLFGAYALGLVPGRLLGGPASDRYGRRKLFVPGCLLSMAGCGVLSLGPLVPPALLLGRLMVGAATGIVASAGSAWIGELAGPAYKAVAARRATVALSAGFGLGPLCSGLLAQWGPAPMLAPYAVPLSFIGLALLELRTVPDTSARSVTRGPLLRLSMPAEARRPFFRELVPMAPWVFAYPSIAAVVVPGALREHVASWAIAYGGAVACTSLGAGVLVQPLTRRLAGLSAGVVGLGVGTLGLGCAVVAVSGGAASLAFPAAALMGVGYGLGMTAGLRRITELSPPDRLGGLTGIYFALTYVGFAAPLLIALADRAFEPVSVLCACTGLSLASTLWIAAVWRRGA